jgi:5'-AMP-activated protein kinase regulatory beta subunit
MLSTSAAQERVARSAAPRQPVPVTFRWSLGGQNVSVTGSFLDWKTELRMERQVADGTFSCTHALEPGTHQYKFIVDGVWRHHPDQPTVHDEVGNINNFVDVVEPTAKHLFPRRPESPPGDYAQIVPDELHPHSTANLNPDVNKAMRVPNIPPHLLRALLNTAPSPDDPSTLPLPHHVMVNHLYVLPRAQPAERQLYSVGRDAHGEEQIRHHGAVCAKTAAVKQQPQQQQEATTTEQPMNA